MNAFLRTSATWMVLLFLSLGVSAYPQSSPNDSDGDGVEDSLDCAPNDPRLSSTHTYYYDLDGDQFGDANHELELCAVRPFPGSVVWGNDPDDGSYESFATPLPKGERRLGLDLSDTAEDGAQRIDLSKELGVQAATFRLQWSYLETAPGVFDGPQTAVLGLLNTYAAEGLQINLTISPIQQTYLTLPADMSTRLSEGTLRLSDPEVIDRFKALLDFIHQGTPALELSSLQIGHELDLYFGIESDIRFWADFLTFFQAAAFHAKSLWGDELPVGATSSYAGLLTEPAKSLLREVNAFTDMISVSYHPRNSDFSVVEPTEVGSQLDELISIYPGREIGFESVSYPSSPAIGSSETKQTQFFYAFFDAWDRHRDVIPFASFGPLTDVSPEAAQTQAGFPHFQVPQGSETKAAAYLGSLGLRTYPGTGEHKSGYHTLRNKTFERGWWRDQNDSSRSYLLGFTPFLYDKEPGGPIDETILDEVMTTIGSQADLVSLHFDKGVPWTEAFFDSPDSPGLPYSDNLQQVWALHRNHLPPAVTVAAAINPLGIPRDVIAPYWGLGEGFYHDENFERVGNGAVQDYEDRLPPPPWDGLALDSDGVKTAYLNYARRVIEYFRPRFLITGLEVNLALESDTSVVFDQYVELQRYLYEQIRANPAYDDVKIVVSFAAEFFMHDELGVPLLVDALAQEELPEAHFQALESVLPYLDVVGLSVYPAKTRFGTLTMPASMFDDLFERLRASTDKPFAITETGYPAATFRVQNLFFPSDPEKQARYMKLLLYEMQKQGDVEFITNFLVRDPVAYMTKLRQRSLEDPPFINPSLVEFFQYFEHIGLLDETGDERPAADVLRTAFDMPVVRESEWVTPVTLASPNGEVVAVVGADESGQLYYNLKRGGHVVLEDSPLGLTVDSIPLGTAVTHLELSQPNELIESYPTWGAHSIASNHYNEATVSVRRGGSSEPVFHLILRLYDDGFAYHYIVPGEGDRTVSGEASGWTIPYGSTLWYQVYTDNYEAYYQHGAVGTLEEDVAGPLTVELPAGAGFITLSEAALLNYSGMTFKPSLGSQVLRAQFLQESSWAVNGGSATPWRVAIVGDDLEVLVNSHMITNLSDPPDPSLFPEGPSAPWIRPGRAVWSWWSDYQSSYSFDAQKQYVDYAHTLGFEYVVVDAWWEQGFPDGGNDQFERLAELVHYANSEGRNVGIWVWKSWFELTIPAERQLFLDAVRAAGGVGVKIDNGYGTESETVQSMGLYEAIAKEAAERRLMVNFHGSNKPTGLSRTYPNEITREGSMGLEINGIAWEFGFFVSPEHNAILPFTRYVLGPADYTPVTFDERKIGATTFAHQLATAGLFSSPLLTFAGDASQLIAETDVLDVLQAIPTHWDETRVLSVTSLGTIAALAKRSGPNWFVFIINGDEDEPQSLTNLDLSFLGERTYRAVLIGDETKTSFQRSEVEELARDYPLDVALLPGGGFVGYFEPSAHSDRSFQMGFTSLPPSYDGNGWTAGYTMLRDHADLVAHSFQQGVPWPEALLSADVANYSQHLQGTWEFLRSTDDAAIPDHDRYLMINPIATSYEGLAPYYGEVPEMSLPAPWNSYDFNHPDVKTAFVNYLIAAVEFFQPKYLAINVEANILLAKRPEQWEAFKELNAHAYITIKGLYPELTVFSTIHYEHMLGLHIDSRLLEERFGSSYPDILTNEVRDLLRHSDLFAISTYPYMVGGLEVREGFYDDAYAIADELGLPIAVDQTGFASRSFVYELLGVSITGSEEIQDSFISLLLEDAQTQNFRFVVNFVSTDYGTNYGSDPVLLTWAYAGLQNTDRTAKRALATWDRHLGLNYNPTRGQGPPDVFQTAGNVIETTIGGDDRVDYLLEEGAVARVSILAEDIVRVRLNPTGSFTNRVSGAIAGPLSYAGSTVYDADTHTYLLTPEVSVIVQKQPFSVFILRSDGTVVTSDDEAAVGWNSASGLIVNRKVAFESEHFFGLGLRGGPLNRRGDVYFMRNTDNGAYSETTQPLYSSTPFYYGERDGSYYGVFLDNPAEPFFDMDSGAAGSIQFGAQKGELDYYVFAGPEPRDVARAFADLTGYQPLPAKWTIGYHQSRFGYQSWAELLDLANTFRALEIPADAFHLDLDYMDQLQLFTWDPARFDDPIANNLSLENLGFKRVNIIDPVVHIGDPLWPFLDQSGFFLQDVAGNTLVNNIFYGDVSWIDFTRTEARDWYADALTTFLAAGSSGVWNDLNEPAQNNMPEAIYDFDGELRTDQEARNLYALRETSLTHQTLLDTRPNERPFILSRSGYPGIQRYAANWGGDTWSTFDSLRVAVQMSLHMGLSGQNQFGHDVGGFLGSPSPELFIRWLQFGSLTPFFRNHAMNTSDPREPWQFGEPYTTMAREIIHRRYRLLPYLYTLFEKASRTGEPVLAPTFFHFPSDPRTFEQNLEIMLGPYLLVAPVVTDGAVTRTVYLPAGSRWFDFATGQEYAGGTTVTVDAPLEEIPIFVREGTLLVTGPVLQYVDEPVTSRVEVQVYPGSGEFILYEDDGDGFEYQAGDHLTTRIRSTQTPQDTVVEIDPLEGGWSAASRTWGLRLHQSAAPPQGVILNGVPLNSYRTEAQLETAGSGWFYSSLDQQLLIHFPDTGPATVSITK